MRLSVARTRGAGVPAKHLRRLRIPTLYTDGRDSPLEMRSRKTRTKLQSVNEKMLFRACEGRHLHAGACSAETRDEGDHKPLAEIMLRVAPAQTWDAFDGGQTDLNLRAGSIRSPCATEFKSRSDGSRRCFS